MSDTNVGVPGWVVFTGATLVASIFAAGTVGLLLLGRIVPGELWQIDVAVAVAYFGGGPFSLVAGHLASVARQHADTNQGLIETTNHAIATMREAVVGATNTATTMAGGLPASSAGGTAGTNSP